MAGRTLSLASRTVLSMGQSSYAAPAYTSVRHFFRMLNAVFNKPDRLRIKEVGPDRACAEWLLRCGAQVRWKDHERFNTDYNALPASKFEKYKIEEINAHEAAVMDIGFVHLDKLQHVKKVRFHHCPYLEDTVLLELQRIKDSLEHLEISSCGDVTDNGLSSLTKLTLLQTLLLYDLPAVRDKPGCLKLLQKGLPQCQIDFKDITKETKEGT